MTETIDARGLACPQPVILTRNALTQHNQVLTIVDSETSRHNVSRMAEKEGCVVVSEERGDGVYLTITYKSGQEQTQPEAAAGVNTGAGAGPLVVAVQQDIMGRGDEELGRILVRGFFHTLGEVQPVPDKIIFYNTGVRLVVEGSPVLDDMKTLEAQGVEILCCGTCLGHFELSEKLAVGEVSNMYSIAEALLTAGKVVNI